ncbi:MAG: thioredoxin family protein [Oscillospiraceae bacterium]|nr:thioredoxin family protein [Oscillospiraceae bacterium]
MKKITMFYKETCPYCRAAIGWMNDLMKKDEKYRALSITMVEEDAHPEIADKYDYYYVPTYYVDDKKLHEGAASLEKVKAVFDAALEQ